MAAPNSPPFREDSDQVATGVAIKGFSGFYELNPESTNDETSLPLDLNYGLSEVHCRGELDFYDATDKKVGCVGSDGREVLPESSLNCGRFVAGFIEETVTRKGGYETFVLITLDFWRQCGNRKLPQQPYYCDLDGNSYPGIRCDYKEKPNQGKLSWNEREQLLGGSWGRGGNNGLSKRSGDSRGVHSTWTAYAPEGLSGGRVIYSGEAVDTQSSAQLVQRKRRRPLACPNFLEVQIRMLMDGGTPTSTGVGSYLGIVFEFLKNISLAFAINNPYVKGW
ncbi:MAG: hypothetical protein M1829_003504 [Trizodia sp. TS-e1964]|nr:MAG: hypothetical protein M1829_003504 [Trizodia sp. TS-e1964]